MNKRVWKFGEPLAREIPYAGERWFQLLTRAVAESSVTAVAARLSHGYERKYGRPAISQVLNGIYAAKTDKIAARVLEVLDRWECPYLQTEIVAEDCKEIHSGPTPHHDPARLAQRRVCRTCKHSNGGQQ